MLALDDVEHLRLEFAGTGGGPVEVHDEQREKGGQKHRQGEVRQRADDNDHAEPHDQRVSSTFLYQLLSEF